MKALTEIEADAHKALTWLYLQETLYFKHTKSGRVYTVTGFTVREADCEILVTYRQQDDTRIAWSRPLAEFEERFEAVRCALTDDTGEIR